MSSRKNIDEPFGVFFITFTCYNWMNLFEEQIAYHLVYKQFDKLQAEGHYIIGYVIMPNHVHFLIGFRKCNQTINQRIGVMKRFLAYDIIDVLEEKGDTEMMYILAQGVNKTDKKRGKLHQVFEPSFDCKWCYNENLILQKLNYIHLNPAKGVKPLAVNPGDYIHSSAGFYINHQQGVYDVFHYAKLQDIDLSVEAN